MFVALPFTSLLTAICGLIYVFLTVKVILLRGKYKQAVGEIKKDDYQRRNGALTNFANTTPIVLILMALAEINRTNAGVLFFFGGLYLIGRISHIISLYYYEKRTDRYVLRVIGMMCSFMVIIAFAAINLYNAFNYFSFAPNWRV